ncbi:MAG: small basic protein [Planctomycetes bacterium]|nr:small basic protein [Planctomycetota bacterium]
MSLHKSLKQSSRLVRRRNVLTRVERIEHLEEDEHWDEDADSVFALPKVKPAAPVIPRASLELKEEEEPESESGTAGSGAEDA